MLVPLPSNHIVKFWFLELPKTHLEFLMTHQERQRACLQLTTVTAISRKEKLHHYIWNPQMQVAKDPPPPNTHSSCWVSDWWITDCSEMWRWASELTYLGVECWETPEAALPCIISLHCNSEILKSSPAFYLPATAPWPNLTVNCHLYNLQPPSDKPSSLYRVSLLFIHSF